MKISKRKRACPWMETDAVVRDRGRERPVMVRLQPRHMELRLKGTRRIEVVAFAGLYENIVWTEARARAQRSA